MKSSKKRNRKTKGSNQYTKKKKDDLLLSQMNKEEQSQIQYQEKCDEIIQLENQIYDIEQAIQMFTRPSSIGNISFTLFFDILDELIFSSCLQCHKQVKTTGVVSQYPLMDIFQKVPSFSPDLNVECEHCHRTVGISKFAPHLEKCMGKSRRTCALLNTSTSSSVSNSSTLTLDSSRINENENTNEIDFPASDSISHDSHHKIPNSSLYTVQSRKTTSGQFKSELNQTSNINSTKSGNKFQHMQSKSKHHKHSK